MAEEEDEEGRVPGEVAPLPTSRVISSREGAPVPAGLRGRLAGEPQEPSAPTGGLRCKYCKSTTYLDGRPFENLGHLGRHVRDECPEYKKIKATRAGKPTEAAPPETAYKTEPDLNDILRNVLEHPDIPDRVKDEIMDWAKLSPQPINPQQLAYLLDQMKGVQPQTANVVAQKYALAIQKAQLEGRLKMQVPLWPGAVTQMGPQVAGMPSPFQVGGPQTQGPPYYQQPPYYQAPYQAPYFQAPYQPPQQPPSYQYPPQQPLDSEALARKVADEVRKPLEEQIRRLEDRMNAPTMRGPGEVEGEEEFWEPIIDQRGKVQKDEAGEVVYNRRMRRPRSTGLTEESIRRIMEDSRPKVTSEEIRKIVSEETERRVKPLEEKLKPKEVTVDEVAKIIDEKMEKFREKPPSAEDIKKMVKETIEETSKPRDDPKITEMARTIDSLRSDLQKRDKEMEKEEKERLNRSIENLASRIDDVRRMPQGEFKSDEMKVLAGSIDSLTSFLKTRSPGKDVIDLAKTVLIPQAGLPQEVPQEARKTVLETLRDAGLAVAE